ncbi:DUF3575 domain-containing protein [Bergeyella zoohelcum]|uniref:DUF3575 domain-containing protein n=1 Tax=Bergeyella zoohelcum TaxID=1015 RepID=UPI002A919C78|nr:DUF3575 domain-containing protein [Bergeyella zoohelcum]MDY6025640.1 DUF3575 domain-containing protein [Bergeyella zoohelcum]
MKTKNKIFLLFIFCCSLTKIFCQEKNALKQHLKAEFSLINLSLDYDLPLSEKFLLNLSAGVGGANLFSNNRAEYRLGNGYSGQFAKVQARYYLNREKRAEKGKSLVGNAGSFVAFQSKFNWNGGKEYIGEALLNDITFGQILPLGKRITFKYYVGAGYGYNLKYNQGMVYPAISLSFGFVIL